MDEFVGKMDKIQSVFGNIPRGKIKTMTCDEKREYRAKTICYLCVEKSDWESAYLKKSETIVIIQKIIEVLHNQYVNYNIKKIAIFFYYFTMPLNTIIS